MRAGGSDDRARSRAAAPPRLTAVACAPGCPRPGAPTFVKSGGAAVFTRPLLQSDEPMYDGATVRCRPIPAAEQAAKHGARSARTGYDVRRRVLRPALCGARTRVRRKLCRTADGHFGVGERVQPAPVLRGHALAIRQIRCGSSHVPPHHSRSLCSAPRPTG